MRGVQKTATADDDVTLRTTSRKRPSLLNVILLYLTLIGLGGICGYFGFNFLDGKRCETLLDEVERRHKTGAGAGVVPPVTRTGTTTDPTASAKLEELQIAVQTRQLWQTVER